MRVFLRAGFFSIFWPTTKKKPYTTCIQLVSLRRSCSPVSWQPAETSHRIPSSDSLKPRPSEQTGQPTPDAVRVQHSTTTSRGQPPR